MSRDARKAARETKRVERVWTIRAAFVLMAVLVSGFTDDLWAEWFDDLIGAMGDGSTAAAFVGWLAGFSVLVYALIVIVARRRWPDAFQRTWVIGLLLLIPFLTLQPSRTRRSSSIESKYWYLGSFFDLYGAALGTLAVAAVAGGFCAWQSTRADTTDSDRSRRWFVAAAWVGSTVLAVGTLGSLIWVFTGF